MKHESKAGNIVHFPREVDHDGASSVSASTDYYTYEREFIAVGMTPEQREEFLRVLWRIIITFIDLAYGVHPTQRVLSPENGDTAVTASVHELVKRAA